MGTDAEDDDKTQQFIEHSEVFKDVMNESHMLTHTYVTTFTEVVLRFLAKKNQAPLLTICAYTSSGIIGPWI